MASDSPNAPFSLTLRVFSHLLAYPGQELRAHLPAMRATLRAESALRPRRMNEIDRLMDRMMRADPLETEADYVELFDRGRSTSLHLFEHVHGDSRDRGPAMIDLARTYSAAGLHLAEGELPDYLPVVLEFVSTQPAREARAFLAEMVHILNALFSALQNRNSSYASVLGALIEFAGGKAQAIDLAPEEPIDASWPEPPAFDGCSSIGQSRPGTPQPINIVRRNASRDGAKP